MRRHTVVLAALIAVLAGVPAVALGVSAAPASNSSSYPDSVGEDAAAPDVTNTNVANDDAGNITFTINISNRPALTQDMLALLFLDTDRNPATGDQQSFGADYAIQLVPGEVDLFQWNGSDYAIAPSASSLTYAYAATGATIRVNASELGKTKGFNFALIVISGITPDASGNPDFTNAHQDVSPDPGHGTFAYQVLTKLTLTATAFTTSPKPAKAGRPFSVGLAATQSDTGAAVQAGSVACAATVANKRIAVRTTRLVNGVAACVWSIPKKARGKTIRGTITLTVQGVQLRRTFSAKIT